MPSMPIVIVSELKNGIIRSKLFISGNIKNMTDVIAIIADVKYFNIDNGIVDFVIQSSGAKISELEDSFATDEKEYDVEIRWSVHAPVIYAN